MAIVNVKGFSLLKRYAINAENTSWTSLPSKGYINTWWPSLVSINSIKNSSALGICEYFACLEINGFKNHNSFSKRPGSKASDSFNLKKWLKCDVKGNRPPIQLGETAFFALLRFTKTVMSFNFTNSKTRPAKIKLSPGFNFEIKNSSIIPI